MSLKIANSMLKSGVALACVFLGPHASSAEDPRLNDIPVKEFSPGVFRVAGADEVRIDRHGVCRLVRNAASNNIMVPVKSANEWASGGGSFLNNLADMSGVSVKPCQPRMDSECFFWVSGIGATHRNNRDTFETRIGDESLTWEVKNYDGDEVTAGARVVPEGSYPDSYGSESAPGPFFRPSNGTFDSIAVGESTTVEMFRGKNFTGEKITVVGPKVMVNVYYRDADFRGREFPSQDFLTRDWSTEGTIFKSFPPSTRSFISNQTFGLSSSEPRYVTSSQEGKVPLWRFDEGSVRVTCE
ncbi:MAG: hypothetical protein DI629_20905 [Mesorhizobium amorphae]|nr:MAG: hypothetical protein DI629_20905 [Mesorhizobium amorphae]